MCGQEINRSGARVAWVRFDLLKRLAQKSDVPHADVDAWRVYFTTMHLMGNFHPAIYIVIRYMVDVHATFVGGRQRCSRALAGFYGETNPLWILSSWTYKIEGTNQ